MSNMDWAANGLVVPADKGFKSINYGNAYVECMERSWDGKFSMKVVASALGILAEAKEAYAFKLAEISRNHILPESDIGSSTAQAWNGMKKTLLEECKELLVSAKELKGMSTSLVQFKHTQTIIKRKIAEQAAAIEKELGDAMDETLKAKNKFDAAKATAEQLVTKVSNADLRPEMKAKLAAKVENIVGRTKLLDQDYYSNIKKLNEVQFRHKESMDEILENLQTVDEARLLRSKACLEKLAKIHENDTRSMSEHSKALIAHSSLIDVGGDITKFVGDTSAAYDEASANGKSAAKGKSRRSYGFFGGLRRKYHTHKNTNVVNKSRRPNGPFRMARYEEPVSLLLDSAKLDWRSSKAKEYERKEKGGPSIPVISNAKVAKPPPRKQAGRPPKPKPKPSNNSSGDEEKKSDIPVATAVPTGDAVAPPVKPRNAPSRGSVPSQKPQKSEAKPPARPPPSRGSAPPKKPQESVVKQPPRPVPSRGSVPSKPPGRPAASRGSVPSQPPRKSSKGGAPPIKPRSVPPKTGARAKQEENSTKKAPSVPTRRKPSAMENGQIAPPETPLGPAPRKPPARYQNRRPPQIIARGTLMPQEISVDMADEGRDLLNSAMSV